MATAFRASRFAGEVPAFKLLSVVFAVPCSRTASAADPHHVVGDRPGQECVSRRSHWSIFRWLCSLQLTLEFVIEMLWSSLAKASTHAEWSPREAGGSDLSMEFVTNLTGSMTGGQTLQLHQIVCLPMSRTCLILGQKAHSQSHLL